MIYIVFLSGEIWNECFYYFILVFVDFNCKIFKFLLIYNYYYSWIRGCYIILGLYVYGFRYVLYKNKCNIVDGFILLRKISRIGDSFNFL